MSNRDRPMESQWLKRAKRLQAIAGTGIAFSTDPFDVERYEEVSQIALALLADLAHQPIERIAGLVKEEATGYVTPKIDVRGAVFHEGRILLVREKRDGLWTLPGGFADVGLSPAENIEKEVLEEAGLAVKASYLYSIRHKARGEYDADVQDYYKLFFLCEGEDCRNPAPGAETSGAEYFELDRIPPLSTTRTVASDLHAAWNFNNDRSRAAAFD